MKLKFPLIAFLLSAFILCSCQNPPTPSKDKMIKDLTSLCKSIVDEKYSEAKEFLVLPEGMDDEKLKKGLLSLIEKDEISLDGIKVLEKKASFGKVIDLYKEKGEREIKAKELDSNNCYGLYINGTNLEAMAIWDEQNFKFFRIDNIGKME